MNDVWKKNKTYIIPSVFFAVILALLYFSASKLFGSINSKIEKIQEQGAEKEEKESRLGKIPELRKQFELIQAGEENIKILVFTNEVVLLLEELEKLAIETNNDIEIKAEENQGAKKEEKKEKKPDSIMDNLPGDKYLKMKISLWGSYADSFNFVRRLENMRYWSDIISLQVSYQEEEIERTTGSSPFAAFSSGDVKEEEKIKKGPINSIIEVVFYLSQ